MTRLNIGAGLTIGWSRGPRLIEFFAWDAATGARLFTAAVTEKRRARLEALFRELASALLAAKTNAEKLDNLRFALADIGTADDAEDEATP